MTRTASVSMTADESNALAVFRAAYYAVLRAGGLAALQRNSALELRLERAADQLIDALQTAIEAEEVAA